MEAINLISQDLFDKIRSKFSNLEMGNTDGAVTIDPTEARFFDFDFVKENINLGRISISLNDLGSLKIYYSQGITENQDTETKKLWYSFLREMRKFAMRRLLRFDTRDISKLNLNKNDFQYLASKKSKEDKTMNMNESRWVAEKSSKKTSRAVKGGTQVIVRHHKPVEENFPGARSQRKNIKAIYIENRDGERFKYPFIHPAGAFAMAQHVDHGGVPHDPAGKAIVRMSEQIAQLQEFQRQVQHSSLHDDAMGITERAVSRLQELKKQIEYLGKRNYYESWLAEFNESKSNSESLSELDPVTFEDYKSKFTQTSFKEEIGKYFPLLHSIMQEKIDLETYVNEDDEKCTCDEDKSTCPVHSKETNENIELENFTNVDYKFENFEQWAENVQAGKFNRTALDDKLQGSDLLEKLSTINLGPNGSLAWNELSELFGLDERDPDDASLKAQLASRAKTADLEVSGPNSPALEVFKNWIEDSFPEWKGELPELFQDKSIDQQMTQSPETGMDPAQKSQPVAEDSKKLILKTIAEKVKSFYNQDNETLGPWPKGQEGVVIEVEKEIKEKFGEKFGDQARELAEKFVENLTSKWHEKHGEPIVGEKLELERLKELLNTVKSKVEEISDQEPETQRDVNIKWRNAARDAMKQGHSWSPTNLPGYVDRMKKLAGIPDKK